MIPLEKDIETKLRKKVEAAGGWCLKWTCPGWAGVPDRLVLLPGGMVIFVETKRPKGGKLSARQKWWRGKLSDLGFNYRTVWDAVDVAVLDATIYTLLKMEGVLDEK